MPPEHNSQSRLPGCISTLTDQYGLLDHRQTSKSTYDMSAPAMMGTMANQSGDPGTSTVQIKWAAAVADHDYAAAEAYLSLKLDEKDVTKAVRRLRDGKLTTRRANDILRAAGLTAAPLDDPGVMKDLIKAIEGKTLSPVLVLSSKKGADIADGFHRVSLVYRLDPYSVVPLKIG
jgi:hypothetical protein